MGGVLGVGDSEISPMAAVSGRNSDAMTMRWLLKELIVVNGDDGESRKLGGGRETCAGRERHDGNDVVICAGTGVAGTAIPI